MDGSSVPACDPSVVSNEAFTGSASVSSVDDCKGDSESGSVSMLSAASPLVVDLVSALYVDSRYKRYYRVFQLLSDRLL